MSIFKVDLDQELVKAAEEAALRRAAQFCDESGGEYRLKDTHWMATHILTLIPEGGHLERAIAQSDQKWIDAFGAQDLVPRVTPESLAEWVFRDVEQQLAGLERAIARARLEESEWWEPYLRPHVPVPCQQRIAANRAAAEGGKP